MKTHWKKLTNPDYLGAYDFQPNECRPLTIAKVERKQIVGADGKKEECTICHWKERCKPMILNVTNAKAIEKVAGSPYVEDWSGSQVYVVVQRVKAFGEMVDALRIKPEKVKDNRPEIIAGTESFDKAVIAIKSGQTTLEDVIAKRKMTPETIQLLGDAVNATNANV